MTLMFVIDKYFLYYVVQKKALPPNNADLL
jgi:hypothetical protein